MPRLVRSRFDQIKQCEHEMRTLCRDMQQRRSLADQIQRLLRRQMLGWHIDEIALARAKVKKHKLDKLIPERWDRLHARMDRMRERLEKLRRLGPERNEDGDRAHS